MEGVSDMADEYEYPTDEELSRITDWDILKEGVRPLIEYIQSLWWMPEWGFVLRDGYTRWNRRHAKKLELHTGGWSGNESIIGALQQNWLFWSLFWEKSEVGGHYWFTIPMESWEPR